MAEIEVVSSKLQQYVEFWISPELEGRREEISGRNPGAQLTRALQLKACGFSYQGVITAVAKVGDEKVRLNGQTRRSHSYFVQGEVMSLAEARLYLRQSQENNPDREQKFYIDSSLHNIEQMGLDEPSSVVVLPREYRVVGFKDGDQFLPSR